MVLVFFVEMKYGKRRIFQNYRYLNKWTIKINYPLCYELRFLGLDNRTTLVLSNTRELDRVPSTEQSTLYTNPHGLC